MLRITDWRGAFWVLTSAAILLTGAAAGWLPRALETARRHTGGFGASLRSVLALTGRAFGGYLPTSGFVALFAYVSASLFIIQMLYGASA